MSLRLLVSDDDRMAQLIEALQLVAADAEQQIPALSAFRAIADQIQRGEQPGAFLDEQLTAEGAMAEHVQASIQRLDELFDQLIARDDPSLWTAAALRQSDVWSQLRTLARNVLQELGVSLRNPRIP